MSDPVHDAQSKGKEFYEKAKAGNLDEGALKWGLSAGAILSGVSLFLNYFSVGSAELDSIGFSVKVRGIDLLRFDHGMNLSSLGVLCIPLSAIIALYLHFGESSLKLLKMETPGRAKLVYLITLIMAALGVLSCIDFLRVQLCLGSTLGTVGLGLLAFVYYKLWQMSPPAPTITPSTPTAPPPSNPPAA